MKIPGDLIQSDDYALAFRRIEPQPEPPRRLLVLVHGWGSDEMQLAALGGSVDDDTLVVLPRAPRSAGESVFGWYRVVFDEGEAHAVVDEMQESAGKLVEFIDQLQTHHDVAPSRTVIAGFSQGGALAAHVGLQQPPRVAGFAMISGRLLPQTESAIAHGTTLRLLSALIVHGRDDETLPPEHAAHAAASLRRLGVAHAMRPHDAGHVLTATMQADVADWFADPGQPWNA